jgi:hypothetical protein
MLSYIAAVAITVDPWLQAPVSLGVFAVALMVTRCVSATELREFARTARNKHVREA